MANPRNYLNQQSPKVKQLASHLYERIEALEAQIAGQGTVTKPFVAPVDAAGHTITGLKHAVQTGEAVPFDQLQQYVESALKQRGL